MSTFKLIEGEYVIVSQGGLYKQVPMAERNGVLYACVGGGYASLRADGGTSKDKLRFIEMSWTGKLATTGVGFMKLCRDDVVGCRVLDGKKTDQLLLGSD